MIVFPKSQITPQLYRVADIAGQHVDLHPITLGALPMQSPVSDLRRYRIRPTDEVTRNDRLARVIRTTNPLSADLYVYEIEVDDETSTVAEFELSIHEGSLAADPADMLGQFDLAPWRLVSARSRLLKTFFDATAKSLGIVGYNGARMLPIPHQINAARYALQFGRVRFLLADEVGLGKTIQAGLIISTLRKYFPDWTAAVFVPESLTAQWAFEMYGKFGKTVFALSEEMDDNEDEVNAEAGVILPHERARGYSIRNEPEILVVDEAHRVLRDPALVQALIRLSRKAHAVLLLTATPVSDDARNLLQLFQILDPERYGDMATPEELREQQERQGRIEAVLKALRDARPNLKTVERLWKETGIADAEVAAHIADAEGRHELHRLAALIVDKHYPGARMLRYRRKFLAQDNPLPFRIVDSIDYRVTAEEDAFLGLLREWLKLAGADGRSEDTSIQRIAAALVQASHSSPLAAADWIAARRGELEQRDGVTGDPIRLAKRVFKELPLVDGEAAILDRMAAAAEKWARATRSLDATGRALARTTRYEAFLKFLKETLAEEPDAHILVFTSFESNVHPLWLLVRKALNDIAEVFEMTGIQSRVEREKNAFEFQEFPSGSVLVSDELGGEGRNFQFATHVVHFDLPLAPWIVEQRIGRCDRVGREEELDVHSLVLAAKGQLDEAFFDFLSDGVGVFNESIAPVEGELDRIVLRAMQACLEEGATGVLSLIEDTSEQLVEARDRENAELLVRGAVGVEEARRIAKELDDRAELEALRQSSIDYARLFDSMVDEQSRGRVAITVGEFHSLHGVPGVRGEMVGYFDRREAVRHERLEFFSPGHPFIRALARTAMTDSPDRAAIIRRKGIREPALVCAFRASIPPEFFGAVRKLPMDVQPPLLSRSAALFATRMVTIVVDLHGNPVEGPALATLLAPFSAEDTDLSADPKLLDAIPGGWDDRIARLSEDALELAAARLQADLPARRAEFEDLLCEVFARVDTEHGLDETSIAGIMEHFEELSLDLDSAVFVVGGK